MRAICDVYVTQSVPLKTKLSTRSKGGLWLTGVVYHLWNREEMKDKVVVLRELQRAIIYTNELSKQAIECHVSRAFIVYCKGTWAGRIEELN
jgi:hypothetical protein